MATKLPKMGEKKWELWQPSCWKLGEKFNINSGNEVVKNEGKKKKEDLGRKLKGKKIVGIDL